MNNPINRTIQKTWQYWYVDGLVEIASGVTVLVLAGFQALVFRMPDGPLAGMLMGIGQPLIIIGGMWLAGRVVRHFKERLTYPRTGFVSYPKPKTQHRAASAVLAMVISISLVIGLAYLMPVFGEHILPAVTAFFMALFLAFLGWRFDLKRFYLIAGLLLLSGLVSAGLRLPQEIGMVLVLTVLGVCSLISGVLVLRRYLSTTTPVEA